MFSTGEVGVKVFHTHRYRALWNGILKHRHAGGYITVDNGTCVDLRLFTQYDSCNYILKLNTPYTEHSVCMHNFVHIFCIRWPTECMYVCVCVCVCVCMCIYIYIYIYVCVCVCVCMYICIYIYVYICATTSTGDANGYKKHKYDVYFCNFQFHLGVILVEEIKKLHYLISALKFYKINKFLLESKLSNFVTTATLSRRKRVSHLLCASRPAFRSYGLIRRIEKLLIPDVSKEYAPFIVKDQGVLPRLRDP